MPRTAFVLIFLLFFVTPIAAQDDSCPALVNSAITVVDASCQGIGRNQACYGHVRINSTRNEGFSEFEFATQGDVVDVAALSALQLGSMILPDEWGVALMALQANLPDTLPGQNVTMLLFGDVEIENIGTVQAVTLDATPNSTINVRSGPSTDNSVISGLSAGETVIAEGRNQTGDWIRVRLSDDDSTGWLFVSLVTLDGDIDDLPVVDASMSDSLGSIYGPMQAFTITTGVARPQCAEAPLDGILIQTPAGQGSIEFVINEIQISLGSTTFIRSQRGESITFAMIEGQIRASTEDGSAFAVAGTQVRVPLDDDNIPIGRPTVEPYDLDDLAGLPLSLLPSTVSISAPLTEDEIADLGVTGNSGQYLTIYDIDVIDCGLGIGSVGYSEQVSNIRFEDGGLLFHGRYLDPVGDGVYAGRDEQSFNYPDGSFQAAWDIFFTLTVEDPELITGTLVGEWVFPTGRCPVENTFTLSYIGEVE